MDALTAMTRAHYRFSDGAILSGERPISRATAEVILDGALRDALKQSAIPTGAADILFHRDLITAAELRSAIRQFDVYHTQRFGRAA